MCLVKKCTFSRLVKVNNVESLLMFCGRLFQCPEPLLVQQPLNLTLKLWTWELYDGTRMYLFLAKDLYVLRVGLRVRIVFKMRLKIY